MAANADDLEARVYRIDRFGFLFAVMTVLFTGVAFTVVLPEMLRNPEEAPGLLMFFGVLGWFWFNVLSCPFQVIVERDGRIVFRSALRRKELRAQQIRNVRGLGMNMGFVINHDAGKIWLRVPLEHNFDFLSRLRELNPQIELSRV